VRVDLPSTALHSGALLDLGLCARHGTPATRSRVHRFSSGLPAVVVVLAFFSFLLVLLLYAAFKKDVAGPVPECERCATTYRHRTTVMWIGLVGGPALLFALLAVPQTWIGLVGLALFVIGLVAGVMADHALVRGSLSSDLGWLELRGVDPAFAAAVQEGIKVAPQPDPWVTPLV